MTIEFVWDPTKAAVNERKHRVSFAEALTVFADPFARVHDDPEHSFTEHREFIVGHSLRERLLVVFFTERVTKVRIFSARQATPNERKDYEKNKRS